MGSPVWAKKNDRRVHCAGSFRGNRQAITLTFALALVFVFLAGSAMAQSSRNCGERAQVVQRLVEGYGETRRSLGPGANNTIIEVFASVGTGTWTIIVTLPSGITCLVAAGQAYEEINEDLAPDGMNDLGRANVALMGIVGKRVLYRDSLGA